MKPSQETPAQELPQPQDAEVLSRVDVAQVAVLMRRPVGVGGEVARPVGDRAKPEQRISGVRGLLASRATKAAIGSDA